jgi:hypothetical protein
MSSRPDYGIGAPGVVRNLGLSGAVLLLVGVFLPSLTLGPNTFRLRGTFQATGLEVERRSANPLATFPPLAIVVARKPLA